MSEQPTFLVLENFFPANLSALGLILRKLGAISDEQGFQFQLPPGFVNHLSDRGQTTEFANVPDKMVESQTVDEYRAGLLVLMAMFDNAPRLRDQFEHQSTYVVVRLRDTSLANMYSFKLVHLPIQALREELNQPLQFVRST